MLKVTGYKAPPTSTTATAAHTLHPATKPTAHTLTWTLRHRTTKPKLSRINRILPRVNRTNCRKYLLLCNLWSQFNLAKLKRQQARNYTLCFRRKHATATSDCRRRRV